MNRLSTNSEILAIFDDAEFKQDGGESGLKHQAEVTTTGGIQQNVEFTDDKLENAGALSTNGDALNNQIDETPLKKIVIATELKWLLLVAAMQNVYQLISSDVVNTSEGKTLLGLNEAAFLLIMYGFLMPTCAGGHIAMALGVSFAAAAYLATLSFVI